MGHTLPTVTQHYHRFLSYVKPFRRALRKSDQAVFDALLAEANQHLPATSYAANLLPGVGFLLSLVLEKHKQILHLEAELENLRQEFHREQQRSEQAVALQLQKLRTELLLRQEPPAHADEH